VLLILYYYQYDLQLNKHLINSFFCKLDDQESYDEATRDRQNTRTRSRITMIERVNVSDLFIHNIHYI